MIRPEFRGLGYASEAIDVLAAKLKTKGVTGVQKIMVLDKIYARSAHLVERLGAHFA